ncbi:MAG: hypothetical protein ACYDD4_08115 [Acidimicrobiales bacterium]
MSDDPTTTPEPGVAVVGGDDSPAAPVRARRAPSNWRVPSNRATAQPPWLVKALIAIAVVSLVAALCFAIAWNNQRSNDAAAATSRADVTHTATQFLLALTNFRPNTIDADFSKIAGYATGTFAKQSNQFFGSNIRQQLEAAQAESDGQIRFCYVQTIQGDQANVYAEVDQTYANAKVTQPIADVLQVVLDETNVNGTWKISAVTVLPAANSNSSSGSSSSSGG